MGIKNWWTQEAVGATENVHMVKIIVFKKMILKLEPNEFSKGKKKQ